MVLDAVLIALSKPSSVIDPQVFQFLTTRWNRAEQDFRAWVTTPMPGGNRTADTGYDD